MGYNPLIIQFIYFASRLWHAYCHILKNEEHGPGIFNRNRSEVQGKVVRYSETLGSSHKSEPCTILRTDLIEIQTRRLFVFSGCDFERGVRMVFLPDNKQTLMSRLEMKGLGKSTIPGFIWSLKRCLRDNPDINYLEANQRLQFLGWYDFDLDYHTLQLAITNFEAEQ